MVHRHILCALKIATCEHIKIIDIVGNNPMQLKNVIIVTPELNDYSHFEVIGEHTLWKRQLNRKWKD